MQRDGSRNQKVQWIRDWKLLRNIILFVVGLSGVIAMTVVWIVTNRTPDPSLLIAFTAMAGLPVFLRADEKDQE